MPLFDTLEREVSSFFVAQGSIFDTILKTVLERLAHVESRVDANVHTVNKLALSVGIGTHAGTSGESTQELEYFVLTLARQVNVVLALLFQPYAHNAVAQCHDRQQNMPSISHVLTDNESILMNMTAPSTHNESVPNQSQPNVATSPQPDKHQGKPPDETSAPNEQSQISIINDESSRHEAANETTRIASGAQGVSNDLSISGVASAYKMIHHLHTTEEQRHRHERELLERMTRLLQESQTACQAQCRALHDQNDALLQELQHQNEKLSAEWAYQQEHQASIDLLQAQLQDQQQKELDKQLLAFSNTFLASQTTQEQQITRILDTLREYEDRFVLKTDMDQHAMNWLQTARDDCIFGADIETLLNLKRDLGDLQQMLSGKQSSPTLARLMDEITKVIELLERLLQMLEDDNNALHGPSGSNLMQSLRQMIGQLEELAHDAFAEPQSSRQNLAFLTNTIQQMELGTASLLEAIEKQQAGYQQALSQQQADLDMLKVDLQAQKLADAELRQQLMECPNQEDTMRLVNALKEQIQASASDSASRMLDTVDDLRSKMAGLPTHDFLEELLHSKADRSEIDRLRLMLASIPPTGGPSLTKSQTRCLSCDQELPFMHSRPSSASKQPNQSERPMSAGSASNSRPGSRGSSPTRKLHHQSMVELPSSHTHTPGEEEPLDPNRNRFVSPFTRAMLLVSEHGMPSTHDILRDLAATIESTKRRRQRMQDPHDQLGVLDEERTLLSFAPGSSTSSQRKSMAVPGSPDDRKNKFPLRRATLSDQVVYGPSITSGFIKSKKSIVSANTTAKTSSGSARRESEEIKTARPKTAITNDRRGVGGDVIMRSPSTTVVIRPFSEMGSRDHPVAGRRNTRAT